MSTEIVPGQNRDRTYTQCKEMNLPAPACIADTLNSTFSHFPIDVPSVAIRLHCGYTTIRDHLAMVPLLSPARVSRAN
jgi:hypothetical protein